MANRKVSIVVHDMSSNTVWAATALARALQPVFDVQVVGPDMGGGVCEPYRDAFPYTIVATPRLYRWPDFLWNVRKIQRAIDGDVVIAVKAYMDTVPVALRLKKEARIPALVYLDEWDSANWRAQPLGRRMLQLISDLRFPLNDTWAAWVERRVPCADAVICSSAFLARRFGGVVVPIGVDTDEYKPPPAHQTAELKRSLGMAGDRLLVFGGVARPHKGLEKTLQALRLLNDERVRLVVIGPQTDYLRELQRRDEFAPYIVCLGAKPKEEMPRYLALADLAVISLQNTLLAQSQVPCKVFEAMAMAKPIIATDVSDLPHILKGCGWIVPPGDPHALADTIRYVLAHPVEAAEMGARAREKCVREYDRRVTSHKLIELLQSLMGKRESAPVDFSNRENPFHQSDAQS